MHYLDLIQWCLEHLNYWTITILMAIESSFIPFPSEIVIPPAAWKAATDGSMSLALIILFGTIGALIGALVNYYLSLWLGRAIIYGFVESRMGRLLLLSRAKVERAEKYFKDNGAVSTLIGRLIPAVRQLISIPAGLSRMEICRFLVYTALGAMIWNTILALMGHYLARVPGIRSQEDLLATVERYSSLLGYGFIVLGLAVLVLVILKERRRSRATRVS